MLNFRISPVSFCSAVSRNSYHYEDDSNFFEENDDGYYNIDTSRCGSNTYCTRDGVEKEISNEAMRRIKRRHPDRYNRLLEDMDDRSRYTASQVEQSAKKRRKS